MVADWRVGAYARRWAADEVLAAPVRPVVLEPTMAQLARGERVCWVESTTCGGAARLRKAALGNGWEARLSRSRYLSTPTNAGALERRGRRLEVETVALRLAKGPIRAWFTWSFDVERGRWSADGGQFGAIMPNGRLAGVTGVTIERLEVIIGSLSEQDLQDRRDKRADAALERKRKREAES